MFSNCCLLHKGTFYVSHRAHGSLRRRLTGCGRLLNGVGDPSARARLVVALENPPPDLEPGYRVASFDIVLGKTPPA